MSKTIRLSVGKIGGSPQVAQESVSQAGMVGRQLASVGQTVASTGLKVGTLIERRRAEEARVEISKQNTRNKIESKRELEDIKERFKENPIGMSKELNKLQEKRHNSILKGVQSPAAKSRLTEDFEISRLENQLTSASHERVQFTKKGVEQEIRGAEDEAQLDFLYPPAGDEFKVDLANTLDLIDQRDFDDDTKDKVSKQIVKTRTKGVIDGYMQGGHVRDFNRAEGLVNGLAKSGILPSDLAQKHLRNIDNERRRKMHDDIFQESQSVKAATKAFDKEKDIVGAELTKIIENPDYDPTSVLKGLKSRGVIIQSNYKILPEAKMSNAQKSKSDNMKYSAMEELTATSDVRKVRNIVNNSVLAGQMSAEAAKQVLTSAQIRSSSKSSNKAFAESDSMLKKHATSGSIFDKSTDNELLHEMKVQRDNIVQLTGVTPYEASLMTLKEFGKNLPITRISGLDSDTSNVKGAKAALEEIVQKQEAGEIDKKKAGRMYERVEKVIELLEADTTVTLKEFLGRDKK